MSDRSSDPMPLQSIIVIVLRLFAIQWFFTSLVSIVTLWGNTPWRMSVFPSICWLVAGGITWFLSQPLSRFVTKGYDATVNFQGLTRLDLYSYSFVFVGLGFFLRGIATILTTAGVMFAQATASASSQIDHSLVNSIAGQLPRHVIEMILGLISVLFANRFAKKLASREE